MAICLEQILRYRKKIKELLIYNILQLSFVQVYG